MEYKFRAWDKENGKWFYSDDFEFMSLFWVECELKGLCFDFIYRFTDLTDKNGKEIYEGDILAKEGHHNRLVIWQKDGFAIQYINHENEWTQRKTPRIYKFVNGCEIIGNKFQHPHLLNQERSK